MTKEYIERSAVCNDCDNQRICVDKSRCPVGRASAADVVEVKHAEWVVCGDGENVPWMCSHCGKTTAHKYKVMYGKFCPNCGAKMDGE